MENQRPFLVMAILLISAVLYIKWIEFTAPPVSQPVASNQVVGTDGSIQIPSANPTDPNAVPSTPTSTAPATNNSVAPTLADNTSSVPTGELITVTTDLMVVNINTLGGVIQRLETIKEPVSLEQADQGFPLLKNEGTDVFVAEDGLLVANHTAPNHTQTQYQASQLNYDLASAESISVPLRWVSDNGVEYVKTLTFHQGTYVIDIDYQVTNRSAQPWNGYLYAQFSRTPPQNVKKGFGQLPSFSGAAIYTQEEKYEKISFDDIQDGALSLNTDNGWVSMLQHYFVAAWIPNAGVEKEFYTGVSNAATPRYRVGFKTLQPVSIAANQSGSLSTKAYIGSKEQKLLKAAQTEEGVEGLALTVDYGWLTFIADPLFVALSFIHSIVQNWGWAIIFLTLFIKILFYPLSAASFKSMAKMRKVQPRMKTLKERYKDDKQKFQMEMMALYKKEKINPAGGCLPILIQIPVFIALYWVLLESVEMRHAPFALWLKDLSAPDPYFVLPVLMGASMWLQQKINPAPLDDIQKKVMMIMPIALTFLFLSFPQGLVLYWVVNNCLTIAQQLLIYRQVES